ncbi:PfkB family carbohydrate kinase [Phytoactinopolyspora halotolerans]|uniref:Bifunctional heptose 7-phosphate kinase/heptose 1-phosphate adenyltransferase n=1 Tax=Phytoactinopolyspora halotolerans TaxID=1981512 RepID=A0A6L9SB38_9ACTN|nr:PfkB family carbohydrate kinase [Phytoactinopolyspora halotolerans]NEE02319.1 bifunctional heptose 7-phosphate kinase/heptose 1-phosphate adenyltransferase [Phytoactinopolyspora halotolerans]
MSTRVVVIGDALLDVDLVGEATRLSPDAPVPVVDGVQRHVRPGGAALAACLAATRGADVTLVTPLANDEAGWRLRELLEPVLTVHPLPYGGSTPVKNRIRAGEQSIVRLDTGGEPAEVEELPTAAARELDRADAILVSDYGRGVAESLAVREALDGLAHRPPVVWDPHPRGAQPVPGVHLVTPNAQEASAWLHRCGVTVEGSDNGWTASLRKAEALLHVWQAGAVAVTLGAQGALLTYGQGAPLMLSAPHSTGGDACGAGDAFAATATTQLAAGTVLGEAAQQAVIEATHFVQDGGATGFSLDGRTPSTSPPDDAVQLAEQVNARGGVLVATGGCFDLLHSGHVACLQAARRLGDALVVCLNSDESVRRLKGDSRPVVPAQDRARILLALECVDAVQIFDEDTPAQVLRKLRPQVWAKGGDYSGTELSESPVVAEWGGHVVTLPYVGGWSTSALVDAVAKSAADGR